jgi:hypothetical protein
MVASAGGKLLLLCITMYTSEYHAEVSQVVGRSCLFISPMAGICMLFISPMAGGLHALWTSRSRAWSLKFQCE